MKNNKFLKIIAVVLLVITTAFVTRIITVRQVLSSNENFGKVIILEKYLRENYLYNKDIKDEIFCITDIETNGGIKEGQIIEIGAVKLKNGLIIDKFKSFIKADFIPEEISDLTGIVVSDLDNAPNLATVLEKFKLFLGTSVFVAHNVKFDYDFISKSLEKLDYGVLLNRRICTIELARRTIPSAKYGLGSLKELLGIHNAHHRALNDAISAAIIFKVSLERLPWTVQTVEDLIHFSKTAKSVKIVEKKE